jgi:pyruvate formate lyase activating enzyme
MDPQEHLKHTGVSNELILKNLQRVNAMGKPIIIRVPIIPGYTDSDENLNLTAEYLATLTSVERVDLMSVHEYGKVKYDQIGKIYGVDVQPIAPERQAEMLALFKHFGLNAQLGG